MNTQVLLTHHHRDAMENAAARGFWMPLELPDGSHSELMYLTSLSRTDNSIKQLLEITSLEPWREGDGITRWLPFTGQCLALPRPIPLGQRRRLAGWLPRSRTASQVIALDALLEADCLSDLLVGKAQRNGEGRRCAGRPAPVPSSVDPVARGCLSWRTAH